MLCCHDWTVCCVFCRVLFACTGKLDQAQELAGHLAGAYPDNPSVNMLRAVLLAKSGKVRGSVSRERACGGHAGAVV